jgi:phosphoribosylaminoimidazolecarboxamide formyltransferase/IMP cyclohydrolase
VENIDIGGPTMVRAAAKNYKYVATVVDTADYQKVIEELKENNGALTIQTRYYLMEKAFGCTADYDALISTTMSEKVGETSLRFAFDKVKTLRYGENSHQSGLFLRSRTAEDSLYDMNVLHGKELSFNNIVDIYSALDTVRDLRRSGCVVIKHTNPCGLCEGDDQRKTFEYAWVGDPVSAFGSVIAFNNEVEKETVEFLDLHSEDKSIRKFVEVVIAPSFTKKAKDYLFIHKNLRVVEFDPAKLYPRKDMKFLYNSLLYQDVDRELREDIEFVTENKSDIKESLIDFGLIAVRQLKSNAIAVVREVGNGYFQLLGMGCGQPNRVVSVKLALDKCTENLKNEFEGNETEFGDYIKEELRKALLVSDAFFPFPDNIEVAANYGIRTIIQPGGSIRDRKVIDRCNELGVSMAFTWLRHFKH